jgi:phosphate/sulfate permease
MALECNLLFIVFLFFVAAGFALLFFVGADDVFLAATACSSTRACDFRNAITCADLESGFLFLKIKSS